MTNGPPTSAEAPSVDAGPGSAPAPDDVPPSESRTTRVAGARAGWTRHLVGLGGPNNLLWHRDLPTGTLDLTTAHPGGVARLLAGRPTRLSDLVREPAALEEARRRARAVAAKSGELAEERGLRTGFLAIGLATWAVRLPDGRAAPRAPAAPVLLRSCSLRATGPAADDHVLDLGAEFELNPVLVHYLASEQGIALDVGAIEALATEGSTLDPYPVYAALAQACTSVPDFAVAPRLLVSTFWYAKLPMVADLASQGDALADHDVVAALSGDPDALRAVRSELGDSRVGLDRPEHDVLVLDADGSQEEAVAAVRAGSHLVVLGPPGTGKSQTIANLVATLAHDGKRVLFVAEKRAAIDTVVGRLDGVGLGGLVLDLHAGAHDGGRAVRELVDDLDLLSAGATRTASGRDAVTAPPRATSPRAVRAAAGERLADHVRALHDARAPWGVSLHDVQEAVSAFAALPRPPRSRVRLTEATLAALDRGAVTRAAGTLASLASLAEWDGPGADDPWFGAGIRSAGEALEARERVERLAGGGVDAAAATLADVFRGIRLPGAPSARDWARVITTVGSVRDSLEVFRPQVFDIPLGDLVAATGDAELRRSVGSELGWLERWRLRRQARALLRPGRPPADLHAALSAAGEQRLAWRQLAGSGGRPEIPVDLDRAADSHTSLVADLEWLDARLPRAAAGQALADADLDSLRTRVAELAAAAPRSGRAPAVTAALEELTASGLRPLVDDLRQRRVPARHVTSEVEWVWWSSLAEHISRNPRVASHDGPALSRAAAEFADADRAVLAENAVRVRAVVSERATHVVGARPEQEALLRADGTGSRRRTALRDLVAQCPDVVTATRPCWAMSPLVVAAVLPPGLHFDVVILDEASQVCTAEAVSAISRARQVVVVGDPRQLPPTPFLTTVTDGHAAAAEPKQAPAEEAESVLDALGRVLPSRRLAWHYRSRDERLIAFADAEVYGGSLLTFPGTGAEPALRHVLVQGHGMVAEGEAAVETTTVEVDRVVELVLEHARTRPHRSLGVVSLGVTHATRVEDALRRALAGADEEVRGFFDEDQAEPFFVKGLERVQGDERDDVVLTVGYGKTPHGRVLHRFGPLSTQGGERHLAVAITRARRTMTVVSSIAADDLDPSRLRARGAVMLRDYLAYAGGGTLPGRGRGDAKPAAGGSDAGAPPRSVVVADLARRLRDHGLVVHENVGSPVGGVDLAVEDPARPGRLMLAVESDGPRYAGLRTPRERDRLRAEQLGRLGWRHVRVWSTDVFRDPARDVARILEAAGAQEAPGD